MEDRQRIVPDALLARASTSNRSKQIPPVPGDVSEHGDPTVYLGPRLGQEGHPGCGHPGKALVEVAHPEEESNAPTGLIPDNLLLVVAVRPRQ